MDHLVAMHVSQMKEGVAPEVEAAGLPHRFSQIHLFQDSNGRVSRALASVALIRDGLFPLVRTRDDENKYLDALETPDRENLRPWMELFANLQRAQLRKATALSENILSVGADIASILNGLLQTAPTSPEPREAEQRKVF